jgi:UDP-glucuronate 4-epimerase
VNKTFAEISKSKEILGYEPKTDFESGIKKFVQWYIDNK